MRASSNGLKAALVGRNFSVSGSGRRRETARPVARRHKRGDDDEYDQRQIVGDEARHWPRSQIFDWRHSWRSGRSPSVKRIAAAQHARRKASLGGAARSDEGRRTRHSETRLGNEQRRGRSNSQSPNARNQRDSAGISNAGNDGERDGTRTRDLRRDRPAL